MSNEHTDTDTDTDTRSGRGLERLPFGKHDTIPVEFSGQGAEYFRIWIVNLLLIVLTLGIYLPWARVRRIKYFYNHTSVAGDSLDFHGEPRKMLRGAAFVGVFFLLYSFATQASLLAGAAAAAAFVALWPLMWWASMRFRLAHTSWRGMRFSFSGDKAGAWLAMGIPLLVVLLPLSVGNAMVAHAELVDAPGKAPDTSALYWGLGLMGVAGLIGMVLLPYFLFRIKQYQHSHYGLGQLRTELRSSPGAFYRPFLLVMGGTLLGAVASGAFLFMLFKWVNPFLAFVAVPFVYVALVILPWAVLAARLQNLVWTRTGNRYVRFRGALAPARYARLVVKNLLLTACTLGLYRPFAAVADWRARVEAMQIVSRVSFESLAGEAQRPYNDAAGEMAADAGIDVGW